MQCKFCDKSVDSQCVQVIMGEVFHTQCYHEMMTELNESFPIDSEPENDIMPETVNYYDFF